MRYRPTPETDAFLNRSFKHRIDELEKLYDHAKDLERQRDEWYDKAHANAAFVLDARKERDEALEALMRIEEIFIDGEDTYEDWKKMGDIAVKALEEK